MADAGKSFDKLRALLSGTDNPAVALAAELLGSFDHGNPVHRLLSELVSWVDDGEGKLMPQDTAIELIYKQVGEDALPVLRARLRKHQQMLNALLKARGAQKKAIRPRERYLSLVDADASTFDEVRSSHKRARRPRPTVRKTNTAGLEECIAFLEAELKKGPRPSADLKAARINGKYCPSHVFQKAREHLKIKARRLGGQHGKWVMESPVSQPAQ